jgi:type I restriction enzyme M protein
MATNAVTALIIPQGRIADYINGKLLKDTPQEYVRQEIEKSLVLEYRYPREELAVEFSIKIDNGRRHVSLAIFPTGKPHRQENVWAIVECKSKDIPATDKAEGIEQLKKALAACPNAEFGMWTNGYERFCFQRAGEGKKAKLNEVVDLPTKGRSLDEAERPAFHTLRKATSDTLLFAFRRCHNYIAANQGLQKPEAFWELLKLIFCKIADERSTELRFYATTIERAGLNGQAKVKARLDKLFSAVRSEFSSIFKQNEVIELEPRVLAYIVAQLQTFSLLESDVDVKGKAYEEIVGSNLRGDRGEFFTPRNICEMAVRMVDPEPNQLILDPACGTGGFLITAMNHVLEKIEESERAKRKKPDAPTDSERARTESRRQDYLKKKIVGIDLNPNLVKAAKMNMVMNNDGSGNLYQGNALARPATWNKELRERDLFGKVDVIFTNPPFGAKLSIDAHPTLEQYDLAHVWDYDSTEDKWSLREPRVQLKSQSPEVLFIERCVQFLKPGKGILAIVLPDAILGSPGMAFVREWILQRTQVLASIDLHPDTFQPGNSTQTSLLILQRKDDHFAKKAQDSGKTPSYDVFMAIANHIGHDKRGNTTFVRDDEGNELITVQTKTVRDGDTGVGAPVYRKVEIRERVVDDNTKEIAEQFRAWRRQQV